MDDHLRAGIAVYNAGNYHAAHDAWEERWLDLAQGSDDERFLHGLIQFTAAVHHARGGNWEGARGLAASACEYLDGLAADYRGVNVGDVRTYLAAVRDDPEHVERVGTLPLTHEGAAVIPADLQFEPAAVAALVFAAEFEGYDEAVLERAVEFARADLEAGDGTGEFVALVMDFASDPANRDIAYRRLDQHVSKREQRDRDVEGLFDQ